jgi:hypothetical protein
VTLTGTFRRDEALTRYAHGDDREDLSPEDVHRKGFSRMNRYLGMSTTTAQSSLQSAQLLGQWISAIASIAVVLALVLQIAGFNRNSRLANEVERISTVLNYTSTSTSCARLRALARGKSAELTGRIIFPTFSGGTTAFVVVLIAEVAYLALLFILPEPIPKRGNWSAQLAVVVLTWARLGFFVLVLCTLPWSLYSMALSQLKRARWFAEERERRLAKRARLDALFSRAVARSFVVIAALMLWIALARVAELVPALMTPPWQWASFSVSIVVSAALGVVADRGANRRFSLVQSELDHASPPVIKGTKKIRLNCKSMSLALVCAFRRVSKSGTRPSASRAQPAGGEGSKKRKRSGS